MNDLGTWQERILDKKPKQTNADRIRAMSDEELALYFAATFEVDAFDGTGNSYKKWLDWLRQEGENGKTD